MSMNTKTIYLLIASIVVVFIVIASVFLLIVFDRSRDLEERTLPIYVIEESQTTPVSENNKTSTKHEIEDTTKNRQEHYLFIDVTAYLRNLSGEVLVFIEVDLRASEDSVLYLVEVRVNNYSRDHPLYSYTVQVFNNILIQASLIEVDFQIPVKQQYANEWRAGSQHKLYIKILDPSIRNYKIIEIPITITESGHRQSKQIPI